VEALGMALPGTAAHPVVVPTTGAADRLNPQKLRDCEDSVKALMSMLKSGLRSRDIVRAHSSRFLCHLCHFSLGAGTFNFYAGQSKGHRERNCCDLRDGACMLVNCPR
jgi:hypothetical protein